MLNRGSEKFDSGFESFRKERNKRRLTSGQAFRPAAQHSQVLQELEAREALEARNQQLTREVTDFFEGATRTAANIVAKVSETEEVRHEEGVSVEMADFLRDAIRRAQDLITIIQSTATGNEGRTELSADVHNLLGQKLDAFRHEGTAQLEDKHIGLDPFAIELDQLERPDHETEYPDAVASLQAEASSEAPVDDHPMTEVDGLDSLSSQEPAAQVHDVAVQPEPVEEIEDHLVAEVVAEEGTLAVPEPTVAAESDQDLSPQAAFTSHDLFERLAQEDLSRLKECLKLLVRSAMMTKSEALEVFRSLAH